MHARVEFTVSQVVPESASSDPNVSLYLQLQTGSAQSPRLKAETDPLLQIRLVPTVQHAQLKPSPSAKVLLPGPALSKCNSYAIRKLVMSSVAPVTLHVYDVSNDARVESINYYTKIVGLGGIFHGAIEVYGREYSFGGSREPGVTGIFACPPKRCPVHHYRESIYLGDCELTQAQVKSILKRLEPLWMARSYNLFTKNCCFFSKEFAILLGVGTIPTWVYGLAEKAQPYVEPYLIEYANRQRAKLSAQDCQKQPANEVLVDHAMAARLQRSYRRSVAMRALHLKGA